MAIWRFALKWAVLVGSEAPMASPGHFIVKEHESCFKTGAENKKPRKPLAETGGVARGYGGHFGFPPAPWRKRPRAS